MPQLTISELQAHPAYRNVIWKLESSKSGKVAVAVGRGGPIDLSYEIHGHGPIHILWIMGTATPKYGWQRQTKYFAHDQDGKYTSLIFDHRGTGASTVPWMRYSTSDMAKDTVELLGAVGWTGKRQLHIVSTSLGGMVAQELALLIPERIASLTLGSTAAAIVDTRPFFQRAQFWLNLLRPTTLEFHLAKLKALVFANEWWEAPDQEAQTRLQDVDVAGTWPTNGDRILAEEVNKKLTPGLFSQVGWLLQTQAGFMHYKSPKEIVALAEKVGRHRIQVLHGTADRLMQLQVAEAMVENLGGESGGISKTFFPGKGHVLCIEARDDYNRAIEGFISKLANHS